MLLIAEGIIGKVPQSSFPVQNISIVSAFWALPGNFTCFRINPRFDKTFAWLVAGRVEQLSHLRLENVWGQ